MVDDTQPGPKVAAITVSTASTTDIAASAAADDLDAAIEVGSLLTVGSQPAAG